MRRLGVCCLICCMLAVAVVSAQLSAGYLHRALIPLTAELTLQHFLSPYNISGNTHQAFVLMCLFACYDSAAMQVLY